MDIGYTLSTYILPTILSFIMLGMGMTLTVEDFKNIALSPRSVAIGLSLQMILLPILAFLIAYVSPMSDAAKVGFVLVSACPGGAISNLLNHLFKANLALSVSLTTVNSFLIVFTLPSVVNIGLFLFMGDSKVIDLSFWDTFVGVLRMTVIPCVIGIGIRHFAPQVAFSLEHPLNFIMPMLLALAMLGTIYFKKGGIEITTADYFLILPFALLLNIAGMALGFFIPKWFGINLIDRLTYSIEVGLQNTGLAITVATSAHLLNNAQMAMPATVYALFSFFTAALWTFWIRRRFVDRSD